ncbi:MAG TPA: ABC transporter ATP-binding protein [Solirubrobacteraceae bacterium]|nr:ABC transporter ATP-binding protein [Solirubrobacteraceae bacterium]
MQAARAEEVPGPIVSVRALAKRYGERQALRDVSFDVRAGELVAVVGPNGAGKTTLLSIVAGAQSSTSGTVSGSALTGGARRVGWAPQQPALYSKLTVRENLRLFARLEGVPDAQTAVARMLEQTGLGARADERVQRLSGGNRQRVNVALGLLADPQLLALDEPSSALDPGQRARLWEFVGVLVSQGTSVLFSTHHLGEVRHYASRAIVLADGEVLFDGAPGGMLKDGEQDLEAAFLRLLRERGDA